MILELGARQFRPDLHFLAEFPDLVRHSHPEEIDVQTMCRIFIGLLNQLPPGSTVHCIVDGVSQFETVLFGMAPNMWTIVDCLQWCVSNTNASVFMKLLLSSADASTVVHDLIPYNQQVDLRSGHMYGSVALPRALIMDLSSQLSSSVLRRDEQSETEFVDTETRRR